MTGRAYCDVYMTLITATRGVVQVAMKEGGGAGGRRGVQWAPLVTVYRFMTRQH